MSVLLDIVLGSIYRRSFGDFFLLVASPASETRRAHRRSANRFKQIEVVGSWCAAAWPLFDGVGEEQISSVCVVR